MDGRTPTHPKGAETRAQAGAEKATLARLGGKLTLVGPSLRFRRDLPAAHSFRARPGAAEARADSAVATTPPGRSLTAAIADEVATL